MSTFRSTVPPTTDELLAALEALPAGTPRRVALMHLATPDTVVGGVGVTFAGGRYGYREFTRTSRGDDAVSIAADVLAVVLAGHRTDDSYLDLTASPDRWVKVLRSGFRLVAFGADTVLGGPLTTVDAAVPSDAAADLVAEVLGRWRTDQLTAGQQLVAGESSVHVVVGDGVITLESAGEFDLPAPWTDPQGPAVHAARVGTSLATLLGARDMQLRATSRRMPDAAEFELTLRLPDDWTAVVPVTVGPGAELVGVSDDQVLPTAAGELPDGFVWCGRSLWDDAVIGWHPGAEVVASLTRAGR